MSITKYRTGFDEPRIVEVQCTQETEKSVWHLGGSKLRAVRSPKAGVRIQYHDTWEEAHLYLTSVAQGRIDAARRQLELAHALAGNVKGLKKTRWPKE